tara:strand:- start:16640 stop:17155 length:516 start_codon:yes stop_codon:yes gene_type:complete
MEGRKVREISLKLLEEVINDSYISRNLERGIFNYTIWKSQKRHESCHWENMYFQEIYKNKLKQVCSNLIPTCYVKNTCLINKLKAGDFLPHEIVFMKPRELYPERWEKIIQEKEKRDSVMSEIDYGQATTQFTCARCKGNKTTYYTMQTRSADEAETVFITCLQCARKWRK